MSLLPRGPLLMPGVTISALCVPAREVGGDYYDVVALPDGRYGVLIADVSGKGMSAALYMAELKGLMLSLSQMHLSPRDLLMNANRLISDAPRQPQLHHDDVRGHRPRRRRDDLRPRGPHAAAVPAGRERRRAAAWASSRPMAWCWACASTTASGSPACCSEVALTLRPGDLLVFFTDGISEAMNERADCFGETRLAELVEEHGHLPHRRTARAHPARDRGLRRRRAAARRHDDDPAEGGCSRARGGRVMSDPVVVFRTQSDIEASIVRGLLEAHGIDVSRRVRRAACRVPADDQRSRRSPRRRARRRRRGGVADPPGLPRRRRGRAARRASATSSRRCRTPPATGSAIAACSSTP